MRKTFADRVYDRLDGDLVKTAQALAHRSVSSTASYLTFRESEIDEAILSIQNPCAVMPHELSSAAPAPGRIPRGEPNRELAAAPGSELEELNGRR